MSTGSKSAGGPRKARVPFWIKLAFLSGALVVVPMAVVGPSVLDESTFALETVSRDLRVAVARDVAGAVEAQLGDAEDGLDAIGRALTDPDIEPDTAIHIATILVAASTRLDHAAIYDAHGSQIDAIREEGTEGLDLPERMDEGLREAAARDGVGTGEVRPGPDGVRVPVAVPLQSGTEVTGYAFALVALAGVQDRVATIAEGHFGDLPDSVFVVDAEHRLILHPDASRAARLESVADSGIFQGLGDGFFDNDVPLSTEYDSGGVEMVGSLVPLPGRRWAVVAQVPRDVAYGPVITMRRILLITALIAVVLALLAAVLLARRITRPIRQLSKFAEDLASRRFDRRVTVTTMDELSLLGDAMSGAAADLEESEARIKTEVAIRADLGRYLSAELVDKVVRREQDMALGGQRREITVLFADVVAFTPLTDELAAEDVVTILNELFTILTEIVFRHAGTVDKFVGDCVMAMWGAPEPLTDHAERAVAAAEEMQQWLEAGNAGWRERYGATIELAIGIHTGEAIVGNVGSESRMEYTAIGDVVNVAARLEAIARPRQILITKETHQAAGSGFETMDLGERALSGRADPIHLFEVKA